MTNTSNTSNDWVQEEVTNEEVITCITDQNYSNKVTINETNTLAPERNKAIDAMYHGARGEEENEILQRDTEQDV